MKFESDFGVLNVNDPAISEDGWITIQSQSVVYNKAEFVVEAFNRDFPGYNVLGYNIDEKFNFVTELCSRQPALREWYALTSLAYSDTTQLPLYLKESVAPDHYKRIQDKLLEMKDDLAQIVRARVELAEKYTEDLKRLKIEEQNIIKRSLGVDNVLKIVNLSTECLPLSIQMMIQGYNPKDHDLDVADSRRRIAQEYLAQFKIGLLKLNDENPNLDVDKLIEHLQLK